MEDENKVKKIIKIVIISIVIIIIGILIFFITNNILKNTNTANYTDYLKSQGYKQDELGDYTKQVPIENGTIYYTFYKDDSILSKTIVKVTENDKNYTTFTYNNSGDINISYNIQGMNNSNVYSTGIQEATYNIKNKKYSCEITLANDFDSKCNQFKSQAITFQKEVEDILNKSNSNAKYIK